MKAEMLTGDDGSRFHLGWLDSELGVDCELALAADGVHRCLPTALAWSSGPASKDLTFTDPQCTQRAVLSTLVEDNDVVVFRELGEETDRTTFVAIRGR